MPAIAARAEEVGYGSVFVPDHVVFPVRVESPYPYTPDGSFPFALDTPLYDPWVILSTIAAATSTIRLGTGIYVLPLRHPLVTARAVTSLDVLSGGRAILGVGAGWLAEEFTTLGLEPKRRFSRTEECIEVLRALWTQDEPEYHGRHFDFDPVHFAPRPVQHPSPADPPRRRLRPRVRRAPPGSPTGGSRAASPPKSARSRSGSPAVRALRRDQGERERVRDHDPVPAADARRPRPARRPRGRPRRGDAVEPRAGRDPRARGVRGDGHRERMNR